MAKVLTPEVAPFVPLGRAEPAIGVTLADTGGETLDQLLQRRPLDVAACLAVAGELALLLAGLHQAGLIHGAVHPSRIHLDAALHVRLLELGGAGSGLGSAPAQEQAYLAPELAAATEAVPDQRSDLYAVGVLLYRMLTGMLPPLLSPWAGRAQQGVSRDAALRAGMTGLPDPVVEIVGRLLAAAPEQRYQCAARLAEDLQRCRADLRATALPATTERQASGQPPAPGRGTVMPDGGAVDQTVSQAAVRASLRPITQALQAISGPIMLDDLLHTLMRIMLEHAEAQNGTLLLVRNERLAPMAQASAASPRQVKLLRDPGTAAASQEIDLPRSVIDHVQRGHQPVLIADTANGHPFSDDPYFAKRRVHALLCLPILRQGTLLGALYLEYDRAAARVTPNHLAVLELLASQSAIALENAMLYADLRGREARIRRLVESNIIGIFFWDLKGGIREANDAFLRMIGYTREELLSGNIRWTDVTPPELMARDMHAKQGLERTGSVDPYEKEFIHKDGHRVPVLLGAALFEQSQEEGVAFVLELTAQKRIEAALRKSEQQWRAVFEHNPTMYFMLDAEGRIVAVNPVGAEQLGYTVEELEGQSVLILFAESEWPAVQRNLATCLAHPGHTTSLEICKVRKDGSRLWVRENAKVMPREDDRSIVLVVCEDITERKRAEEALLKAHQELEQRVRARTSELEQSNLALAAEVRERARAEAVLAQRSGELARSNAELEQMAYVASHDLQEPLRMVSSYLQLLEQRYGPQLDGDAHEFIGFAVDGAKRLQTLIDDLLAYSRVGTRAKPLRPIDSKAALDMALQSLRLAIDESGAQVESGPLPCVTGDAAQLTQLFQNLIGNAIKFRGEDAPRISIAAVPADGFWEFAVQDNGIGIAPEYFDRIFVMFQRLHSRRKYPGTGMGLAICKKIVERHGGRIWAEAVPKGTCFKFTLPRISGDESAC